MKNETIEKAAQEYAEKATPTFVNGDFGRDAIAEAFEDGAEWRISSVWHSPEEVLPDYGEEVIAECEGPDGTEYIFTHRSADPEVEVDGFGFCNYLGKMLRWAALSDILPEKEDK